MTHTCPSCTQTRETEQLSSPSRVRAALTVIKDWRVWAVALLTGAAFGVAGPALGIDINPSPAIGGIIGLYIVHRIMRVRACPDCAEILASK